MTVFLSNIYDNPWYVHIFATVPRGVSAHSLGTLSLRGGAVKSGDLNPRSLAPEPRTWY